MSLEQELRHYFGYSAFRPPQKEIISCLLARQPVLAVLPTGAGKSICYQLTGLMLGGLTIVVSPLISLMKDQVETLLSKGIAAAFLNSSLPPAQQRYLYFRLKKKAYHFLYLAPEKLSDPKFLELAEQLPIHFVAVDEAHCISEWGTSFRPHYRAIAKFISALPTKPVVLAVTATATPRVQQDILTTLNITHATIYKTSFQRHNLRLHTVHCQSYLDQLSYLLSWTHHRITPSIAYTATRQKAVQWTQYLNYLAGKTIARAYHGQLSAQKKDLVQKEFFNNHIKVVVATSAFGMGIDKADIGTIFHLDPALTVEEFYQEVGRAGRNGTRADCLLLAEPSSAKILQSLVGQNHLHHHAQQQLATMLRYIVTKKCRMQFILKYFGENVGRCGQCDNCQPLSVLPTEIKKNLQLFEGRLTSLFSTNSLNQQAFLTPHQILFMGLLQPHTEAEFLKIPGIGKGWVDRWYKYLRPNFHHIFT